MGVTAPTANALLDLMLGTPGVLASTVNVALSTTNPASSLTEPAVGGYARAPVANNTSAWPAATNAVKNNGLVLTFPEATADYPQVGWAAVISGGSLVAYGPLTAPITVLSGTTARFPVGSLSLTLA